MADLTSEHDVLDTPAAGGLIIRGGAVRAAGYVIGTLLALVSFSLITRHLGVARFGQYQTVLSVITVVSALTDAGMTTLAVREYATLTGDRRDRLMRNLLGARLLLTALGVAGAVAFAVAAGFSGELVAGTALAGIGLGLNVTQAMCMVPMMGSLQLTQTTLLELVRQVLQVALMIAAVIAGAGVVWILGAAVPAGLVALLLTAALVRGRMPLRPRLETGEVLGVLRLTVPVALATGTGTVYVYLGQVVTELVQDGVESGLFAASFRVFIVVGAIPGLVVSAAFPLLSRAARDDDRRMAYAVDRLVTTMLVLGGMASLLLSFGAPVAIDVVAGASYGEAAGVLRVQAWALMGSFVLAAGSFALLSLRLHREILVANTIGLVVATGLVLALAPTYGASGSAWATVGGETVLALITFALLVRSRPDLRPRGTTALRVVAALGIAAGAAAGAGIAGLPALVAAAVAGTVFAVAVLLWRVVPAELLELVRRP